MKKYLRFISSSGMSNDGTSNYTIHIPDNITVQEFIELVLKRNEFGTIRINGIKKSIDYRNAQIIENFSTEVMNSNIKFVTGNGGWGRMDYMIYLR